MNTQVKSTPDQSIDVAVETSEIPSIALSDSELEGIVGGTIITMSNVLVTSYQTSGSGSESLLGSRLTA